jgi:NAD(P)-dependent dehydrogenase (short-subunit alcohol dehydrogenase family)
MTGPSPVRDSRLRVGVVGAGRVGAVLAARLREAGHDVVAAAGESDASRGRIAALLPGVPVEKPSAVARACDLLLLTVPDDMLPNVVAMLSASGANHAGRIGRRNNAFCAKRHPLPDVPFVFGHKLPIGLLPCSVQAGFEQPHALMLSVFACASPMD